MALSPDITYSLWECPLEGTSVTLTVESHGGLKSPVKPVAMGSDLMCVMELLDRMDGPTLLELHRNHLPRVMMMRRVLLVDAFAPAIPVNMADDAGESDDDTPTYTSGSS